MGKENEVTQAIVEISAKDGVAFIEQASPLTRLHYFDGKFLRADAFALEQDYHRARTRLANLAGGWGAVHGLGVALAGNTLQVGAGLAITAAGNFVLATADFSAALADLIEVAQPAPASGNAEFDDCLEGGKKGVTEGTGLTLYEITVGPVEGLCGNEAVYGKLCESACVSSSQHPYWREGVVLRLRPISLKLPTSSAIAFSNVHLRNRVASGYFAAEPWLTPPALSSAGLASAITIPCARSHAGFMRASHYQRTGGAGRRTLPGQSPRAATTTARQRARGRACRRAPGRGGASRGAP